jgi:type VI protein secretion system component VasF
MLVPNPRREQARSPAREAVELALWIEDLYDRRSARLRSELADAEARRDRSWDRTRDQLLTAVAIGAVVAATVLGIVAAIVLDRAAVGLVGALPALALPWAFGVLQARSHGHASSEDGGGDQPTAR